ncbi:nitroreductase [Thiomicrorhabdus sp. zzn3]|uniref:nitroreductase family protein n=1 Tax=Thiomicrorhabdus sp. zzn3 TaxID=3039775 RepID=UPI0024368C3E|nr:nitroreductase [Thiomicrorhabdus sp. zzn3]MDG6778764.1 nitroreductase [Thiomicrorhabdus sp. zzn3]
MQAISAIQLLDLIQSRRTCYQFASADTDPVAEEALLLCLEAAIWAPNHKLTQPWRFWQLKGQTRNHLAEIYAHNRAKKKATDHCDYECIYHKALDKFARIPEIILVGQVLAEEATTRKEDYAACCCAIQNFQLMAWGQQIGVQWSTGPILQDPRTYELLAIDSADIELIGALYIGRLKEPCNPVPARRKPVEAVFAQLD